MESQIALRQRIIDRLKKPFNTRRINRYFHNIQLNLTRNSGYYALVSSLMCLCLIGLRSNTDSYHDHDEIDAELHYTFHNWEPKSAIPVKTRERRAMDPFGEPKIVLFWTKYHGSASFDFGLGSRPFESAGCKYSNCKTTTDRLLLNESHAIIFHSGNLNVSDIPSVRFDHQKWIFYTFTSPMNMAPIPKSLNDKFNWTMTYRRDSDIIHRYPYGALMASKTLRKSYGKTRPSLNSIVKRRLPRKKKLVAWVTSTCPTTVRRENYVRELAKHIQVDIYGGCGQKYCGNTEQCMKMLREEYKFVLAFENSLCTDYVTDKLYTALQNGVVPVVYGEADYRAYAPASSYINARDFASPKHLADYLWLLHINDHLYQSYLAWNEDYVVDRFPNDGWCNLCEMLHKPAEAQAYSDIYKWWTEEATCTSTYHFMNSNSSSSSSSSTSSTPSS